MMLMVTYTFAQTTPDYTYVDASGNKYELYAGLLDYTPKTGTNKKVELSKIADDELRTYFKTAIDAKSDRTTSLETGGGTIRFTQFNKSVRIFLKSSSTARTKLEAALLAKIQ